MKKQGVDASRRKNAVPLPTIFGENEASLPGRKSSDSGVFALNATPSEVEVVKAKHGAEAGSGPGILAYNRESRMGGGAAAAGIGTLPPRTRLERYKVYGQADRDSDRADPSKRVSVGPHDRHEEVLKDFRDGSLIRGPMQTINFSLCSKVAVERGWLLEPGDTIDPERKTMIEWLKGRSKKLQKEREIERREAEKMGHTEPLEIRLYPAPKIDSARAKFEKRMQKARSQRMGVILSEERPDDEKWIVCQLPDGTRITYYPSGQTAICATRGGSDMSGFFTYVYDLDESGAMLATFLPSGQGFCYYETGHLRLAMDKEGGCLHGEDGVVTRRWVWPKDNMKLQPSVTIQLNDYVQLRCLAKATINLFFTFSGEIVKYSVPAVPAGRNAKKHVQIEAEDTLKTNLPFTSRAAQEIYAEMLQASQVAAQGRRKSRGKKKSSVASPVINLLKQEDGGLAQLPPTSEEHDESIHLAENITELELDDFGGGTEKDLETLQGRVRFVVDDWMSHYRTTLGIKVRSSPRSTPARDLASTTATPQSRQRPSSGDAGTRAVTALDPRRGNSSVPELPPAVRIRLGCDSVIKFDPRRIPLIFDKVYDEFIFHEVPKHQMMIVYICDSSKGPDKTGIGDMLERIYFNRNKNRIKPCPTDSFRIIRYDIACATEEGDVSLLQRRHNAVPGMIFIYQDGKLLFANKAFNGYSSMKKDFLKQVKQSAEDFKKGSFLPANFRFGRDHSRSRSLEKAWVSPGSVDRLSDVSPPKMKSPTSPMEFPPARANSALSFITQSLSSEQQLINIHATLGMRTSPKVHLPDGF